MGSSLLTTTLLVINAKQNKVGLTQNHEHTVFVQQYLTAIHGELETHRRELQAHRADTQRTNTLLETLGRLRTETRDIAVEQTFTVPDPPPENEEVPTGHEVLKREVRRRLYHDEADGLLGTPVPSEERSRG